jgi:tRNA (guanine26-N2/guanine27-N2)-dimethyltransferase
MIDFYVRVFVTIDTSGSKAQLNPSKIGHVWQCPSCHYFETQPMAYPHKSGNKMIVSSGTPVPPKCPFCEAHFKMAGPIWLGPLHDNSVVEPIQTLVEAKGEAFASQKKLQGKSFFFLFFSLIFAF